MSTVVEAESAIQTQADIEALIWQARDERAAVIRAMAAEAPAAFRRLIDFIRPHRQTTPKDGVWA